MLERGHLAILLALDSAGTLAEAADRLHLTQSALSHAIRKLEDQAGVEIWQKEGRRLRLTQAGQYLLEVARRLLPQLEEAESVLRGYGEGRHGKLRIGMECHPCYEWLLTVVSPFLRRWPLVDLDVVQQFRFNGLEALLNHQVDMVITSDPLENAAFYNQPVLAYELMLVAAPEWRAELGDFVAPTDLADATLITFPVARERLDVFTRFLLPAHCEPKKTSPGGGDGDHGATGGGGAWSMHAAGLAGAQVPGAIPADGTFARCRWRKKIPLSGIPRNRRCYSLSAGFSQSGAESLLSQRRSSLRASGFSMQ
ncbi:MAG: LysR family transcriptional regulator [Cellvibrionaceae bacterium]|nr:LysR family transcriptional regulator [Cellvibrionaceae bacterium]